MAATLQIASLQAVYSFLSPVYITAPGGAVNGQIYYNSTSNQFQFYQAGGWLSYVTGVSASGVLASSGGIAPNITISQAGSGSSGYLSQTDWNTFNNKQPAGNYITALNGDGSASGPGNATFTLATVLSSPGSYGSASVIPNFTVNGKGLITSVGANTVVAPAGTLTGATLAAGVVNSSLQNLGIQNANLNMGNEEIVNISQLAIGSLTPGVGTAIDIVNNTGATQVIQQTSYGFSSGHRGRYANGTMGSPTAATNGSILEFISGRGYGATGFAAASTGAIQIQAAATFTDVSMPTLINMLTTPVGSVTSRSAFTVQPTGQLTGPAFYTSYGVLINDNAGNITTTNGTVTGQFLQANVGALPSWNNLYMYQFGDGYDGNVTITTNNFTGGPVTAGALTRDAYFQNLTISGAGSLSTNGFRIFVAGTLDLTGAAANAINNDGNNGGNAANGNTGTGGAAGAVANAVATLGASNAGIIGGAGTTAAGTESGASGANSPGQGGPSGAGGKGGAGSSGAGGVSRAGTSPTNGSVFQRFSVDLIRGVILYQGGNGGPGGSGGGGDGTDFGGGGGGGGSGGGVLYIAAYNYAAAGAATSAISCMAGNGGQGGSPTLGSTGGGGGGSGGGGGWIYFIYANLVSASSNAEFDVSGGNGGTGGNGLFAGISGGQGGAGGGGGRLTIINLLLNSGTSTFGGTASGLGTTPTNTSGTAGTTGQVTRATL